MVGHTSNPSPWEMETGNEKFNIILCYTESETSQGYMRFVLKIIVLIMIDHL